MPIKLYVRLTLTMVVNAVAHYVLESVPLRGHSL